MKKTTEDFILELSNLFKEDFYTFDKTVYSR